jgi:hypothetical protein
VQATPTSATPDVDTAARDIDRIEAELLFELLRRVRPLFVSAIALIVVFVAIFWETVPQHQLSLWAATGLLVTLVRLALAYRFQSRPRDHTEKRLWRNIIAVSAACGGAVWGAACVFLGDVDPEQHQLAIVLILIALCGAAVVGYAISL